VVETAIAGPTNQHCSAHGVVQRDGLICASSPLVLARAGCWLVALRDRRRGPYSGARAVELVSREVRRRVEARSQTQWLFHHTLRDATGPIAYEAQPNRPVK
jgi:hypothetical protein